MWFFKKFEEEHRVQVVFMNQMNALDVLIRAKREVPNYPLAVIREAEAVFGQLARLGYAARRNASRYHLNTIIEKTMKLLDPKHKTLKRYQKDINAYNVLAQQSQGHSSSGLRLLGGVMLALGVALLVGAVLILGSVPFFTLCLGALSIVSGATVYRHGVSRQLSKSMSNFASSAEQNQAALVPKPC